MEIMKTASRRFVRKGPSDTDVVMYAGLDTDSGVSGFVAAARQVVLAESTGVSLKVAADCVLSVCFVADGVYAFAVPSGISVSHDGVEMLSSSEFDWVAGGRRYVVMSGTVSLQFRPDQQYSHGVVGRIYVKSVRGAEWRHMCQLSTTLVPANRAFRVAYVLGVATVVSTSFEAVDAEVAEGTVEHDVEDEWRIFDVESYELAAKAVYVGFGLSGLAALSGITGGVVVSRVLRVQAPSTGVVVSDLAGTSLHLAGAGKVKVSVVIDDYCLDGGGPEIGDNYVSGEEFGYDL
jgi:hypothetical protein